MSSEPILLRVLAVEDDERMRDLLCRGLRDAGHTAISASDGRSGLDLALEFDFDVIILDIGLPFRDGFDLARALREQDRVVPILMLTARDNEEDILRGFDAGADDYLTKPFSFRELIARIQRLGSRTCRKADAVGLVLDRDRLAAVDGGRLIPLRRSEYLLLACLLENLGAATPRSRLAEAVWGSHRSVNPNTLDVLVNALRGRLRAAGASTVITTVRGVGYCLEADRMAPVHSADRDTRRELSA